MSTIYFITHPEVIVDPALPVPEWHLSDNGVARMTRFAASDAMRGVKFIWSSAETKAIEAAEILGRRHELDISAIQALHENDRSATGFLPPAEFEQVADAFFAQPHESVRGWERAIDAQTRVRGVFEGIASNDLPGDIAIVAHGAVGTLLLCHLSALPISRTYDQPFQGHYWAWSKATQTVLHGWREIAPRQG
ncbi:MAG: histidine phosphatase family protein [Parvibaculum sp.]|nr:histidine phosphatase family protein [Parvibaculum sp.]